MLNRRLLFKTKPAAVAPKETITHHFFVSGIGQKKLSMRFKFVAAQKMLLKNRNPANIRKMDCFGFIIFRHLYRWKRVCGCLPLLLHELPIDMGNSICTVCHYISVFPVKVDSDQPSEGEIIPFSGVCQSGGCIIHAGGGGGFTH